ncbi:MAG: hypothetical protein QF689_15180 [Candidatus Latescibacteria bacterium]|jgi:hypothetical protein|nr:hypothetical protein [Gemmatimonadaceae bacterium]MDP6019304.1 hypothetical protein [Candidatus Latescibacterota bacterium]MDP7449934.1 hypothetical protein [Candidatus Latescibacterota bacterium]HJP31750.1 hypothetical protein [Candidatus Latescibacterota bacterium]
MNEELIRQSQALAPRIDGYRRRALIAGIAGMALTAFGYFSQHEQFFKSYLLGFTFWISLTIGSLLILFIHHLAGGRWGFAIRRLLEAGTQTWLVMLVLGLPVLGGMHELYHWTHAEAIDEVLAKKVVYLNEGFFVLRYFAYFAIWGLLSVLLTRWASQQDRSSETWPTRRTQVLSGPGIIVLVLSATFASVDWLMSLEPHWFSTIFSAIYIIGGGLATWSLAAIVGVSLSRHEPLSSLLTNERLRDLGTFMLGFTMLWAYTSFSQLLIIWSGNLPEEITWYYTRLHGGWLYLGYVLIGFHFFVPFLLLISSRIKARLKILVSVACGLLLMRLLDLYWITAPAFQHGADGGHASAMPHWLDLAIPVGMGGLWLFVFFGQLKKKSLVPLNDPRFDYAALAEEAHH